MEYIKIYISHHAMHPFWTKLITLSSSFNIKTSGTGALGYGRFILYSGD